MNWHKEFFKEIDMKESERIKHHIHTIAIDMIKKLDNYDPENLPNDIVEECYQTWKWILKESKKLEPFDRRFTQLIALNGLANIKEISPIISIDKD